MVHGAGRRPQPCPQHVLPGEVLRRLLPSPPPQEGDIGGGGDVPAGVRDVRGGVHLRRRRDARLAAGPVRRRGPHRHRHDLRHRPHLRRAHEPRRHALLRLLPAFPLDSGALLLGGAVHGGDVRGFRAAGGATPDHGAGDDDPHRATLARPRHRDHRHLQHDVHHLRRRHGLEGGG